MMGNDWYPMLLASWILSGSEEDNSRRGQYRQRTALCLSSALSIIKGQLPVPSRLNKCLDVCLRVCILFDDPLHLEVLADSAVIT